MLLGGEEHMEFDLVPYIFKFWIAGLRNEVIVGELVNELKVDEDLARYIISSIQDIDFERYILHHEKLWYEYIQLVEENGSLNAALEANLVDNMEVMLNDDRYKLSFEYQGTTITDPFLDEAGKLKVSPIQYYGFKAIVGAIQHSTFLK
jgi:hypothetical protein